MNTFKLDYKSNTMQFDHFWELCVGSCHAATALREDYRQQLTKCHKELGFQYVRFHGLFNDDMSVLLDANGLMCREKSEHDYILSFTNIDSIYDFLLSIGMKPFVELGFMPELLTSGKTKMFHYKGHTSPPDDYDKWKWLVKEFVSHCISRYGLDEVRQWFFEVWNEPNMGGRGFEMGFWGGNKEDYFKLYEVAAKGLKEVDHLLKVGGPATADNDWIPDFIQFCETNNVPLDFISTHQYPSDYVIGMNTANNNIFEHENADVEIDDMLKMQEDLWKKIPRGIITELAKKARKQCGSYPLYYTEWNSGAEIYSDEPFGASFTAKTILDNNGIVNGYSYWTFSDIFEEGGMPHTPYHGGFGLLNLQGIPKASYRAFELLHKLGNELYTDKYEQETVDIYAAKKSECGAVQLMVINHQSLFQKISPEEVTLKLTGLPSFVKATVERVDENHANSFKRWKELGSPDYPDNSIINDLMANSYTHIEPLSAVVNENDVAVSLAIPEQGIALVTFYL